MGNVGVASTSPWRTLSVTGTVGFDGLTGSTGAGSLCLDSNKQVVYNSASDACLSSTRATKHDIQDLNLDSLSLVELMQPVSFVYNGSEQVRYGFIAEDAAAVDAHLATYNASGTVSGIDDRSILAILVGAIKALGATVVDGVTHFVQLAADKFTTHELCVDDVCVTRDQFAEVFGSPQSAAAAGASGLVSDAEAPAGSSAAVGSNADTASSTTPSENEPAADAPEHGQSEAPASSASREDENTDNTAPTTPERADPQGDENNSVDETEPAVPAPDAPELAPANDPQVQPAADNGAGTPPPEQAELPATATATE